MEGQIPRSENSAPNACESRRPLHWVSNHTNFTFCRHTLVSFRFAFSNISSTKNKPSFCSSLCYYWLHADFSWEKNNKPSKLILHLLLQSIRCWSFNTCLFCPANDIQKTKASKLSINFSWSPSRKKWCFKMWHFSLVNLVNDRPRSRVNPSKDAFDKKSNIVRAVFYDIWTFWENGHTSKNTRVSQSYFSW